MAIHKLSAIEVKNLTRPGRHSDGGGLYLVIDKSGKRWVYLYSLKGKRREMGLGAGTLAKAREKHKAAMALVVDGVDPIDARRLADSAGVTFGVAADTLIADLAPGWVGKYTETHWKRSLVHYAGPIRDMAVASVTTEDVLKLVRPLWSTKPETGKKLRERLEMTFDAAKAKGWREGENPARWRGHLSLMLPTRPKLIRGHHPALPYIDAPAFMIQLRAREAMSARALEWIILTASRENSVLGAFREEIDGDVWTIPKERMKGTLVTRKAHRVPLSSACLAMLPHLPDKGLLFPSPKTGGPLSNTAPDKILQKLAPGMTTHGFRSTFSDWAGEETSHARETKEAALAHVIGDQAERAYRRRDALEKRRLLMQDWADYLAGVTPPSSARPDAEAHLEE